MRELLLGSEDWSFLGSVALRTLVMFVVILGGLRVMGKRGVKHLSVFELGVIVGLGSAAGDPMFYSDVGLLPAFIVFAVVLLLYRALEALLNRSARAAKKLEGEPVEVVCGGELDKDAIDRIEVTTPEIFTQLRLRGVAHLGQVECAILEPNGELSVYFARDADVRAGLPVIPARYERELDRIPSHGVYSCRTCGHTIELGAGAPPACGTCEDRDWTFALDGPRVT